ncbi:hypothetical protein BFS30_05485 [Pedobacter steynii]|uniref:Uncharacterized protein n=2 Tax=Pedobacter steynii TaxID=430522 RepID=A0A1D7QD80_9SPHI|nr:hypothetical protein BFS30_05485 [Pedobacter steynii]
MITMEEEIWDYIDGNASPEQTLSVEAKIASDPVYSSLYKELLAIDEQMNGMDLEEPSMSFTRNVMEQVKLEIAPVALKTKVDKRIIYSIMSFFVCTIVAILVYVFSNSTFTLPDLDFKTTFQTEQLDFTKYVTPAFIKGFLFIDLLLALVFVDSLLRRRRA